jgi:hypothetical protein
MNPFLNINIDDECKSIVLGDSQQGETTPLTLPRVHSRNHASNHNKLFLNCSSIMTPPPVIIHLGQDWKEGGLFSSSSVVSPDSERASLLLLDDFATVGIYDEETPLQDDSSSSAADKMVQRLSWKSMEAFDNEESSLHRLVEEVHQQHRRKPTLAGAFSFLASVAIVVGVGYVVVCFFSGEAAGDYAPSSSNHHGGGSPQFLMPSVSYLP